MPEKLLTLKIVALASVLAKYRAFRDSDDIGFQKFRDLLGALEELERAHA